MVVHVAEVVAHFGGNEFQRPAGEDAQRHQQWRCRPPQCHDLALERVDHAGLGLRVSLGEHGGLDLVQVVLQRLGDDYVAVHDVVQDRVQHDRRPQREQLRIGLQPVPDPAELSVRTVPDRHHEVVPEEDHHLAGGGHLGRARRHRVVVVHGLDDREQQVLVLLELGPLVRVHRVLDGQWVQPEPLGYAGELFVGRLVQSDPDEAVPGALDLVDSVAPTVAVGFAVAVAVDGAVDDRRAR